MFKDTFAMGKTLSKELFDIGKGTDSAAFTNTLRMMLKSYFLSALQTAIVPSSTELCSISKRLKFHAAKSSSQLLLIHFHINSSLSLSSSRKSINGFINWEFTSLHRRLCTTASQQKAKIAKICFCHKNTMRKLFE